MNDSSHTVLDPPSWPGDSEGDFAEDPRVVEVVQSYLQALESGSTPNAADYVNRYPEISAAVAECLEGLELVRAATPPRSRPSDSIPSGSALPPGADGLPAPLGDFQIIRELARGGMGVVYEAVQLSLGRRVALKVLPFAATFDSRQLQRFKNEAQAAAQLHHTHIVPIYAVGCERGVHFYAMQLIEGQSLASVIQELRKEKGLKPRRGHATLSYALLGGSAGSKSTQQPQPPEPESAPRESQRPTAGNSAAWTVPGSRGDEGYFRRLSRLMVQAADALDHAHQSGVVHRDVKPANLLLNAAGDLWVTDFGLAQFEADAGLTRSGDLLGTFRYMSPEQTSGQRTLLDQRTDIYSLGATFYELLTLEPVFAGETRQELLYQILNCEPRLPRALNRDIPPELETIVLKALSKVPADRYDSAAAFGADIQRYLDHQPIKARRPSMVDRFRKWSRRHPSVVVTTVLLLVVITVALLISNLIIAQERNEAEERFLQARRVVDMLIQISEEELADRPMVHGLRRRLLETALVYYQDFIEQRHDDKVERGELEAVRARVQSILLELAVLQRDMDAGLLRNPRVQEDLQLSEAQKPRLKALLDEWENDEQAHMPPGPGPIDEATRRQFVTIARQHDQQLSELLSDAQRKRLTQLGIQSHGIMALKESDIAQKLGLTAAQRTAIRDLEHGMFVRIGPGGPRKVEFDREQIFAAYQEVLDKAISLLTDQQRVLWRELTGEPFSDIGELRLFGRFGGPPPGDRGPPGGRHGGPHKGPHDGPHDGPRKRAVEIRID